MASHTSGPWLIGGGGHRVGIRKPGEGSSSWTTLAEIETYNQRDDSELPFEANARLIAAAPDLLAAAKRTADILARYCEPKCREVPCHIDDLCAAIAKAEGR